ncbi:hypothetical protein N7493_002371 [Penicillium malachiteum]|uniref:SWI/SNF family DNA-dependent ATPase Ris1 n=1 Tax=Penicillium malachiteum TaxID=1324776 RepID=A0AAD6MYY0_9EURO|nr:hypothetical protein N7493_002371 [Penicillium malachiteum]
MAEPMEERPGPEETAEEQNRLNALLEDLDIHNMILDSHGPEDYEAIAETKKTILNLQTLINMSLRSKGDSPRNEPVSAPPQESPQVANRMPGLPSSDTAFWSSSAPSPFAVLHQQSQNQQSRHIDHPSSQWIESPGSTGKAQTSWSQAPFQTPGQSSRKRGREDSINSLNTPQLSKRTAVDASKDIAARLERGLNDIRKQFAALRQPDQVKRNAAREGISESEYLEEIAADEKENERSLRYSLQAEKDADFARTLQAGDEVQYAPQPTFDLPERPQPSTSTSMQPYRSYRSPVPEYTGDSEDDIEEITPESFLSSAHTLPAPSPRAPAPLPLSQRPYPFAYHSASQSTPHWHSAAINPSTGLPGLLRDSSLSPQKPGMMPQGFGRPLPAHLPLMNMSPGRHLPWMQMPSPLPSSSPDIRAFDLVREQNDMEADNIDFQLYKEEDFPDDIKNLLTGIKNMKDATKAESDDRPTGLKVTLMKHQKIGLKWMKAKEESSHKGGILADDMGLGKTIQTIALMVSRPPTDSDRHPTLIVAPKALMEQWRLEIQRHVNPGAAQFSVLIFHSLTRQLGWRDIRKYDIVITTFGTLTANFKYLEAATKLQEDGKDASIVRQARDQATLFSSVAKWHRVIIDEAQNIKNPLSKGAKACCRLDTTYRWCLTGTPMMNRLEDFQSLLRFLRVRPYNNAEKFKRTFIRPIKQGYGDESVMKQLRVLVKSVCLRRTKKTEIDGQPILQLPPKVIEKIHVVFNEEEKLMYDELNSNTQHVISRYLKAGTLGKNYSHVLVLLLRLRQACDHPLLIKGFNSDGSSVVQGVDLVANAKLLDANTVARIKNNEAEDDGSCPICMDSVENAVIYIPCGHSVCSECFARISDPSLLARQDNAGELKCQNCRGHVDPLKVTDAISFKKAHDPSAGSSGESEPESEDYDSDDSEYDSSEESSSPRKKKTAQRNKAERRKYVRRLEKMWVPSAKTDKTMEILQENEDRGKGEKTIIFSQFTSLLDLLEIPIIQRKWCFVRFDGTMNIADRNAAVAAFTDDPDCRIMLISLKAGNAGLNLISASHVILYDPFWNPYVEDQAIDRAHRIGQTKDVFVHRLLIEETVEDRIIELQEKKRELISGALDEGGSMNISGLNTRELAYLFGVQA